jgi:cysteine desulfurase
MLPFLGDIWGNPSSVHQIGRQARALLDDARDRAAALLGAKPSEIIFTSGGTEANNLALFGLAGDSPGHVIISAIEHPSIVGAAEQLARCGWRVDRLGVSSDGVVKVAQLDELLRPDTRLVSVMRANNETGALQPVAEIAQRCRKAGVLVHTDAVQVAGKLPLSFRELGVDAMTVTAHKLHGPVGLGALVVRDGVSPQPQMFGGFQQEATRPGTESVALAVGFRAALELAECDRAETAERLTSLRDRFEQRLLASGHRMVVNASGSSRLPHTSNVAFVGMNRQAMMIALDLAGVACSTGSACASGSTDASPTLVAMGLAGEVVESSLRFSLGRYTTAEDVDFAVEKIVRILGVSEGEKRMGIVPSQGRIRTANSI